MAEIAHLAWYRQGTISVTNGSTTVTGNGTKFLTAGINEGAAFRVDSRPYAWEISSVVSDTELQLARPYYGGTVSNASYSIDRNHQSTLPAELAARLSRAMGNWEAHYNLEMQTITGKSAYEVAVENGYIGTEAEWLESLKGAGDYSALLNVVEPITYYHAGAHNSIYRGKNLGTSFTPAMYNEIHNGTFRDLYIGDYLELPIDGTTKAIFTGFGPYNQNARGAFLWFQNNSWKFPINDTNTLEGGYIASKMYTETLPALLEKIEAVIDPSYIWSMYDTLSDTLNSNGDVSHTTWVTGLKLFLPAPNNFAACASTNLGQNVYKLTANVNYRYLSGLVWPYALSAPRPYYDAAFWSSSSYNDSHWLTIGWNGNYCYTASNTGCRPGYSELNAVYTWPYIIIL